MWTAVKRPYAPAYRESTAHQLDIRHDLAYWHPDALVGATFNWKII